jgi:hypothetical protein
MYVCPLRQPCYLLLLAALAGRYPLSIGRRVMDTAVNVLGRWAGRCSRCCEQQLPHGSKTACKTVENLST